MCLFFCVRTSLCLSVGFLRGGFLPGQRPCAVHVGAGSQHPVLQEKVSGVCQICGAALPPRCQCLLFTHGTTTFATLEQLPHRYQIFMYFKITFLSFCRFCLFGVFLGILLSTCINNQRKDEQLTCLFFASIAGVLFDCAQVKSFFCRIRLVLFIPLCLGFIV